jgi:hypothetical protein
MDFEELKVIWNSQENEKMYAINESTLHEYIRKNLKSVTNTMKFFETAITGANLLVGIWLMVESLDNIFPSTQHFLAVFYFGFGIYALVRVFMRREAEKPFEKTVVGEVERAIWRIDYLMAEARRMINWYLVPLIVIFGVLAFFDPRLWMVFGLMLLTAVATYFGYRWEFKKIHLPRKKNLNALREKLVSGE